MKKETVLPLLLIQKDRLVATALMSSKGYGKSIEQKNLWITNPETGRILPLQGQDGDVCFLTLLANQDHYVAHLSAETTLQQTSPMIEEIQKQVHPDKASFPERPGKPDDLATLLKELEELIATRRKEHREGSYTTHLFKRGLEHIRKKTGEEAIELILAQTKDEMVYESADLLYHLLVLWNAAGISLDDIYGELVSRNDTKKYSFHKT